jgi:hypothetical protein
MVTIYLYSITAIAIAYGVGGPNWAPIGAQFPIGPNPPQIPASHRTPIGHSTGTRVRGGLARATRGPGSNVDASAHVRRDRCDGKANGVGRRPTSTVIINYGTVVINQPLETMSNPGFGTPIVVPPQFQIYECVCRYLRDLVRGEPRK